MSDTLIARFRSAVRVTWPALVALVLGLPRPASPQGAVDPEHGVVAVGRALRSLDSVKRVLIIGAHPDDEDTSLLTWLERGLGADAAYLSLNRGEGGQNLIGSELGVGLGLIRTGELIAARRLDGAEQFFTRAFDFGYSKSAEETFRFWSKDELLADVVATVREFRPQVIVSVFSGTSRDGHGQHQVAGILAREAFEVAGDPARFPEQIARGLSPWRPTKLYRSTRFDRDATTLTIRTGELDPLYGRSYHQIAMASRSQHRSQDMGRIESLGPRSTRLQLMESAAGTNGEGERGLFDGVDTTLAGALAAATGAASANPLADEIALYSERVARARAAFLHWSSEQLVDELSEALTHLDRAIEIARPAGKDALFLLRRERREVESALLAAAGVVIEAFADDDLLVSGQDVEVEVQIWNGGPHPIGSDSVRLLTGERWPVQVIEVMPSVVPPDTLVVARWRARVPRNAEPSRVYFLAEPMSGALYAWPDDEDVRGRPFGPPILRARVDLRVAGRELTRNVEVVRRYADPAFGEVRHALHVVPAVGVRLEPGATVRALDARGALSFAVTLRTESPDGARGHVRLGAPRGWGVSPPEASFELAKPGAEGRYDFHVTPPPDLRPGSYTLMAEAETRDGRTHVLGYSIIEYPHIRRSLQFDTAQSRVEAFELSVEAGRRVAYIAGAGDAVPDAIAAMGVDVEVLSDRSIATAELSAFDVIVLGIRAYETNEAVVAGNDRLLEWVRDGGTLIVQYQQYAFFRGAFAPYEMRAGFPHDRVSDETAPVRILQPDHRVFRSPNRIGPEDFEGWVQERGLYFPHEWDDAYTPLLESADPGEEPKRGALLVAPYGEGMYVYTGLSLFRQLPAGVPGAYRLLANLLSLEP